MTFPPRDHDRQPLSASQKEIIIQVRKAYHLPLSCITTLKMESSPSVSTSKGAIAKDLGLDSAETYFHPLCKEVKVNSFITVKKDVPDPWSYDPEKAKIKRSKQYSFAKADKSMLSKVELPSLVPGPGAYQVNTSLDETKQLLSNHPKTGAPKLMEIKTLGQRIKAIKYPPLCTVDVTKTTLKQPSKAKFLTSKR